MAGLLLIRANPFHLQAISAARIPGHEVRTLILQPIHHDLAVDLFPQGEVITFPIVYSAPSTGVSEDAIAVLAPYESQILLMLDRANRWGSSLMATRSLYLKLLHYCSALMDENDYSGIVFFDVPQQGFDHIIYTLARERGIPVALVTYTQLRDRVLVQSYIEERPPDADYAEPAPESTAAEAASEYMESGIVEQRSPEHHRRWSRKLRPISYAPAHLRARVRRGFDLFPQGIPDKSLNGYWRFALKIAARKEHARATDFYRSVAKPKPASGDYLFFPLQLQPEATTLPRAGHMVDQVNYARLLASVLPEGWRLAIKEHPATLGFGDYWGRARSLYFYEELRGLPNTDLLAFEADTDALVDGCRFLVTGTGTPGWEAVNRGRPAIVFGWPWYLGAPGVTRATTREELRILLQVANPDAVGPSKAEVRHYAAWLAREGTVPGRFGRAATTDGVSEDDLRAYCDRIASALAAC